jgi:hypothetical protein
MKFGKLILFVSLLPFTVRAFQKDDITVLVQKIKHEYPGYKNKTNDAEFDKFLCRVTDASKDTFSILSQIANFFNDNHLQVYEVNNVAGVDTAVCTRNVMEVNDYLADDHIRKTAYEGYWINDYNSCVIAIRKENGHPWAYRAYVVESRDHVLKAGMVCCSFRSPDGPADGSSGGNRFQACYIDHLNAFKVYLEAVFRNDSVLVTGAFGKWSLLRHYTAPLLTALPAFSLRASGRLLDKDTYLLTIPGNTGSNTKIVDSLVKADYKVISTVKNLVIDIRNNLGGTTATYQPLLPFIYTNPIVRSSGYLYCGDDIVRNEEKSVASYRKNVNCDTARLAKMESMLRKMMEYKGQYMFNPGDTIRLDEVKSRPVHVALIINYACQSAAELMLLDCKQSSKVKTFGEHTAGAVDYLDYFPVALPSGKYLLYIPATRRVIPKGEQAIDGKGIRPDVPIGDNTFDWVEFTKNYNEKN